MGVSKFPITSQTEENIIMKVVFILLAVCLLAALTSATQRQKRQTNFGGGSQQPSFSNNQGVNTGTIGSNSNVETENKIFFWKSSTRYWTTRSRSRNRRA